MTSPQLDQLPLQTGAGKLQGVWAAGADLLQAPGQGLRAEGLVQDQPLHLACQEVLSASAAGDSGQVAGVVIQVLQLDEDGVARLLQGVVPALRKGQLEWESQSRTHSRGSVGAGCHAVMKAVHAAG